MIQHRGQWKEASWEKNIIQHPGRGKQASSSATMLQANFPEFARVVNHLLYKVRHFTAQPILVPIDHDWEAGVQFKSK